MSRLPSYVSRVMIAAGVILCPRYAVAQESVGPAPGYDELAGRLGRMVEFELADKQIPALSIALIDGDRTVWARGFGWADRERQRPATADTVYRVGSISKLFTDLAVMGLVERGALDLDAPIAAVVPGFEPANPFGVPMTLRQLMSHRSGLVRESPVGNYFDPSEPSLADTVSSLNRTELVYRPASRTKYSNAGIAVAGYAVELDRGEPFADYVRRWMLEPLEMHSSSFVLTDALRARLARAEMWTYDGRTFAAPEFALGTSPAGNLYSTVNDLARFAQLVFNRGRLPSGDALLAERTLEEMQRPQFAGSYGIGFHVSELDGRLQLGHGGAVYGFSTQWSVLPGDKLGVVVAASKDVANGVVGRIAAEALRGLVAHREGGVRPEPATSAPVPASRGREIAGDYRSGDRHTRLEYRGGELMMRYGDRRLRVRVLGDALVADGVFGRGPAIERVDTETLRIDGRMFIRQPIRAPAAVKPEWRGLVGEYGWDHNTLYILEEEGGLVALIEWFFYYPLEPVSENAFAFPEFGMYHDERLVFTRDASGRATSVRAADVEFARREAGTRDGETFRITPLHGIEKLRRDALSAAPPTQPAGLLPPDLVELTALDATIKLDIRYATTNNFMGEVFYAEPRAFLQRDAAEALVRVHRALADKGYGLLVHDAYRPWYVTKMFYDATPAEMKHFVANPASGSRHNRGCAVDLTLYELATGEPVQMPSGYDEFSTRAYPDYPGGTASERWHRELLRVAMEAAGFAVYEFEWWHFDYRDWDRYPVMNVRFEHIMP